MRQSSTLSIQLSGQYHDKQRVSQHLVIRAYITTSYIIQTQRFDFRRSDDMSNWGTITLNQTVFSKQFSIRYCGFVFTAYTRDIRHIVNSHDLQDTCLRQCGISIRRRPFTRTLSFLHATYNHSVIIFNRVHVRQPQLLYNYTCTSVTDRRLLPTD